MGSKISKKKPKFFVLFKWEIEIRDKRLNLNINSSSFNNRLFFCSKDISLHFVYIILIIWIT